MCPRKLSSEYGSGDSSSYVWGRGGPRTTTSPLEIYPIYSLRPPGTVPTGGACVGACHGVGGAVAVEGNWEGVVCVGMLWGNRGGRPYNAARGVVVGGMNLGGSWWP